MPWYDQSQLNYDDPYSILDVGPQQYNPSQGYPTKQVSDQIWQLIAPMGDQGVFNRWSGAYGNDRDAFSQDAFFAADPLLRGPLAEALTEAEGDTIGAYSYLEGDDFQGRLMDALGREEWDQISARGDLGMLAAITPEEQDEAARDYYMRGLQDLLGVGAPTAQRKLGEMDYVGERFGGRPYEGGDVPQYSGPGFSGAGDPLAQMASGGSGAGGADAQQRPQRQVDMTATPEGDLSRASEGPMIDLGAAEGPDQFEAWNDNSMPGYRRIATIGGRRYALSDELQDTQNNFTPAYRDALQSVMGERRQREFEMRDDDDNGGVREAASEQLRRRARWLDNFQDVTSRVGTLTGNIGRLAPSNLRPPSWFGG